MIFEKLALISYGTYDGISRIYKLYMVNYKYNLFLEGYLIYKSVTDQKVILNRKVNELFDYSVVDVNDKTKNAIYTKEGPHTIELVNDSLEGFPNRFIGTVDITLLPDRKKPLPDIELTKAIKKRLVPMFDASLPIGEYLFSLILVKYKMETLGSFNIPDIDDYINANLIEVFKTKAFMDMLSNNQVIIDAIKRFFPIIIPITIDNLALVYRILVESNNQLVDITKLSAEDMGYAMRTSKILPLKEVVMLLKRSNEPEQEEVVLDFSEDKKILKNNLEEVLQRMDRITDIILIRNDSQPLEFNIDPLYRDIFLGLINTKNIFFAAKGADSLVIDFIKPLLSYKIGDKKYTTMGGLNKDFEYHNSDKSVFILKLINKRS